MTRSGTKTRTPYYWFIGVVKMWGRWMLPTAPFFGALSSLLMIGGGVVWGLAAYRIVPFTDATETLGKVITLIGVVVALILLLVVAPCAFWKRDTGSLENELGEMIPLKTHRDAQTGHERDWVRLVVENIDLSNRGNAEMVNLCFQLDSGLVYQIRLHKLSLRLCVNGSKSTHWWEVSPAPNLLAGQRTQLATIMMPIEGEKLRTMIDLARKEKMITAYLEVKLELPPGEGPIILSSGERSYVVG